MDRDLKRRLNADSHAIPLNPEHGYDNLVADPNALT